MRSSAAHFLPRHADGSDEMLQELLGTEDRPGHARPPGALRPFPSLANRPGSAAGAQNP